MTTIQNNVLVGAGSAGCVVANRLAADSSKTGMSWSVEIPFS